MPLSWNEIKSRAIQFSKEWENEKAEHAEAKTFWDDFFNVFGIHRRRVATFEQRVTMDERKGGFIDLLWKGHLLVEHKSGGGDLDRAYRQAKDYFPGLKEHELPKYVLVCNFEKFRLYDLDTGTHNEFELRDLVKNVTLFSFIAGYQPRTFKAEAAQKVLNVRKEFEGSSLADLYDPVAMPPEMVKAHQELDKAVDLSYRPQPFTSETKRIEFLFELYEKYTSGLFKEEIKKVRK